MADEQHEIRSVNWNEIFGFTFIFKSFRMAIQPGQMLLAMAALLLILGGGFVLQWFWNLADQRIYQGEIACYVLNAPSDSDAKRQAWLDSRVTNAKKLVDETGQKAIAGDIMSEVAKAGTYTYFTDILGKKLDEALKGISTIDANSMAKQKNYSGMVDEARKTFAGEAEKVEKVLDDSKGLISAANEKINSDLKDDDAKAKAKEAVEKQAELTWKALAMSKTAFCAKVDSIRGEGIFIGLAEYEWGCVTNAISAVRHLNFTGDLSKYRGTRSVRDLKAMPVSGPQPAPAGEAAAAQEGTGFVVWVLMAVHGMFWLVARHWMFAVLLAVWLLAVRSVVGGAIHRKAAMLATRDEKISASQSVRFSIGKFFSFFTAPLLPLMLIMLSGALLCLGGLIFGNWGGSSIVLGLLFFIPVIFGLIIAFLLIGLVAGQGLMYPTIAIEGSDAFDAMSRSFSYVYWRPFRAALYGVIALVYGVVCYLFVRFFAYVALAAAHMFLKWGVFAGGKTLGPNADRIDVLWTAPTFNSLFGPFSWEAMSGAEQVAAVLIGAWVFLVALAVIAFLLSYAVSAFTTIYLLLRRKVDATDLDDVYVEEAMEPQAAPAPAAPEGEKTA